MTVSRERLLNDNDLDDNCDDHNDGDDERSGKGPYTSDGVVVFLPRKAATLS